MISEQGSPVSRSAAPTTDRLIGLMVDQGPDVLIGMLGILGAGRGFVPLDPRSPDARLVHILADCSIQVLVTDEHHRARAERLKETLPFLAHVVVLDGQGDIVAPPAQTSPARAAATDTAPVPPLPDSHAYVIFTSGSTGAPKGVGITHRNLAPMLAWAEDFFALGPSTRSIQSLSYWFDFGVFEQLTTTLAGGTLYIAPESERTDPARFAARAAEWQANLLHCTPSFARELEGCGEDLGTIRILHMGGEALSRAQVDRLRTTMDPACHLYNGYGPTEATVTCSTFDLGRNDQPINRPHAITPIGRPNANHRLFVLDQNGRPVPPGVPGELYVGGGLVARGYLGQPALTAERFVPDPFFEKATSGDSATTAASGRLYRTGDIVRFLPDGNIAFLGRADHQVKLRGFRIELGEIEAVLCRHPAVNEAMVQVREARPGDSRLVAWFASTGDTAPDLDDLRVHLRESLPEYMLPSAFVSVRAWPTTRAGKIDLRALPEPDWAVASSGRPPETEFEIQLATLFADVLGCEEISADDNFFELGGHSLLATRLIARIRRDVGVELPLLQLFEAPTVAETAAEIERMIALGDGEDEEDPIVPVPREHTKLNGYDVTALPLSPAQERLWILDRFEPGTDAFNMPLSLGLRGQLDPQALRRALDAVVERHESLRTTFASVSGVPQQIIHPPTPLSLPVVDLTSLADEHREDTLQKLIATEAQQPFDLEAGPLFRASLVRLEDDRHALLLNLHHVISDGWSIGILTRELAALYDAFRQGRPSPLAPLHVQYADYAVWQRNRLAGPVAEQQMAYWRSRLGNRPPTFELPLDRERPPIQTFRGASVIRNLSPETRQALEDASRKRGASLFMTLLSGFKLLLARWSGSDDIVVGTPIASRNRAATDGMIGIFLNTLVLRTDLSGNPTFNELVDRVRETALGAFDHQDLPFERLLDVLRPARDLARTPLFQVFFNMLNLPSEPIVLEELTLEPLAASQPPSKFDLTLYAGPRADGGFQFNAVYNADLFETKRIEALLDQYLALLEQATVDPACRLAGFQLSTDTTSDDGAADDRTTLPDPSLPLPSTTHQPVHRTIAETAQANPEHIALVDSRGTWRYAELKRATAHIASWLGHQGIQPNAPVAILAHRGATLPVAMLGVLEAGAAFVMLDPGYPENRLAEIIRLANPAALLHLTATSKATELPSAVVAAIGNQPVLTLPPTPSQVLEHASFAGQAPNAESSARSGDDLAYLAFTSGSTGRPKGIRGRHAPLAHYAHWLSERFDLGPDDRCAMLSGLAHDPLLRDVFPALATGASLHAPDPRRLLEPGYIADWLRDERVTVANLTPAMGRLLTLTDTKPLADLRLVLYVGEALRRRDVDRLQTLAPLATVINLYGATETQQALSYYEFQNSNDGPEIVPLGRGIDGVQLLVLDTLGRSTAMGEVGEIYFRSPYLSAGYLSGADDPSDAQRFRSNPFSSGTAEDRLFRTGDLGRYGPHGEVTFAGRRDDQLKIRGFRVEPAEVALRLQAIEGVGDAAVIPHETAAGQLQLVAFVVAVPGAELASPALRNVLRGSLPAYMVPAAIALVDALPVTPNGKLDRAALGQRAQKLGRPQENDVAYSAPKNDLERTIIDLLMRVLALERVGTEDNFFEIGGNSLLLVEFHQKLQSATGQTLQPVDIFNHPSARSLANFLSEKASPAPKPKPDDRAEKLKVGRARLQQRRRSRTGRD